MASTAQKYVPPHLRKSPATGGGDGRSDNIRDSPVGDRFNRDAPRGRDFGGGSGFGGGGGSGFGGGGGSGFGGGREFGGRDRRDFGGGGRDGGGRDGGKDFGRRDDRGSRAGFPKSQDPPARDMELEKQLFGQKTTGINFEKYDDIPVEVSGDNVPAAIDSFAELNLPRVLSENVEHAKYTKPTPVQKNAIPISFNDRDLMACAQTGSGKTAAFLLPLIASLLTKELPSAPRSDGYNRRGKAYPYALILAPTRELTTQIHEEAVKFCYRTGLRPVVIYGGQDARLQLRELEKGVDFIVATPGRLVDMMERGRVGLEVIQYLVLDEADRMLDMGFEPQIREIVHKYGMPSARRTAMFSATFPKEIQRLAQDFLSDYIFLAVGRVGSTTQNISQQIIFCEDHEKKQRLKEILPQCSGLTLIFVETKRSADGLEEWLNREGVYATSIHGDRTQQEREDALSAFRCGRCSVLVATSVAARGLDIPNVLHVINFDMPNAIDDYVHRIGRTGRCGNEGTAIAFLTDKNRGVMKDLYDCLKDADQAIEPWLEEIATGGGWGGGRTRGGRGGRFTGNRDFRKSRDGFGGGGGGGGRFEDRWIFIIL